MAQYSRVILTFRGTIIMPKNNFNKGDDVVWVNNFSDPASMKQGTITKISSEFCWVDNHHKPEDCIYLTYCWPARVKAELYDITIIRKQLKKEYDDSMKLVYQLRNAIQRGEK